MSEARTLSPQPPGRPRDPEVDEAILGATLTVLAGRGFAGLTTDRVAAAAGVSKATIYRRWRSKDDLLVAAAQTLARQVPTPDTGSLRDDLTRIARGLSTVFARPGTAQLVAALVERMLHDDRLAEVLRSGFLTERRDAARTALERGRARGEVRPDIDLEVAVDLLAAPFYYRELVSGQPVDDALADEVVDAVVTWVSP
jgi:AcrR family transcriptional regulator